MNESLKLLIMLPNSFPGMEVALKTCMHGKNENFSNIFEFLDESTLTA